MAEGDVLYEKRGNVVVITMNRPERMNALSVGMLDELHKAWVIVGEVSSKHRLALSAWLSV